jgi:signal transduction histidine kinase
VATDGVEEPELVREGWSRRKQALPMRRALTEVVLGGLFILAALVLALTADDQPDLHIGPAVVLVAMFAAGIRMRIDVGFGYTSPVQLVFVPMLFLLPTAFVPLLVLLGWFLGRIPDLLGARRFHPERLLLIPADCWFSLGPAVVLVLADAQVPTWDDWPIYLVALAAQFAVESVMSYIRESIGEGSAPQLVVRELGTIWAIDAVLSPLGLLAAFASQSFEYAFVLLVPPAALLSFYVSERTQRIEHALALADSARDREGLIAGASHELVTPLGVLVGLTDRLAGGRSMTDERRRELDVVMRREVLALRQVIRQFVDYTRLKTERDLLLAPQPVAVEDVIREATHALPGADRVEIVDPPALPPVRLDPGRANQMVLAVLTESLDGPSRVRVTFAAAEDGVRITVASDKPPRERPFAEGGEGSSGGLGLYVTRELARLQGGELEVLNAPDGGATYILTVPRA